MTKTLRQSGTLLGFLAIILFFAFRLPDTFLTARNLMNIGQQVSMLAVVAATMTIVMVMNDFDLSVGSMASLAGIVAATIFATKAWYTGSVNDTSALMPCSWRWPCSSTR